MRARSWCERLAAAQRYAMARLRKVFSSALKGLIITIYLPPALLLRAFNVYFPHSHAAQTKFGHLAGDPAFYAQSQAIGIRPACRAVLVISRRRLVNPFLLDQWRSRFHVVLSWIAGPGA
jgi:hypothetical protein